MPDEQNSYEPIGFPKMAPPQHVEPETNPVVAEEPAGLPPVRTSNPHKCLDALKFADEHFDPETQLSSKDVALPKDKAKLVFSRPEPDGTHTIGIEFRVEGWEDKKPDA